MSDSWTSTDKYSCFHVFMSVFIYLDLNATILQEEMHSEECRLCCIIHHFVDYYIILIYFIFWICILEMDDHMEFHEAWVSVKFMTSSLDLCVLIFLLQIIPMWWFNWVIYLCLLSVLLLCTLRHVWIHADLIFLRIHGLYMLRFLLNAWNCWIPCCFALCPPHLSIH